LKSLLTQPVTRESF